MAQKWSFWPIFQNHVLKLSYFFCSGAGDHRKDGLLCPNFGKRLTASCKSTFWWSKLVQKYRLGESLCWYVLKMTPKHLKWPSNTSKLPNLASKGSPKLANHSNYTLFGSWKPNFALIYQKCWSKVVFGRYIMLIMLFWANFRINFHKLCAKINFDQHFWWGTVKFGFRDQKCD